MNELAGKRGDQTFTSLGLEEEVALGAISGAAPEDEP
jgi:hypothetical protein